MNVFQHHVSTMEAVLMTSTTLSATAEVVLLEQIVKQMLMNVCQRLVFMEGGYFYLFFTIITYKKEHPATLKI